jgi:signal transduction histidine kinase
LLHLIEDLLFVSGLEDQAPSLDLDPEDIGPLLDQCRGGRIAVQRPDHPLVVALDRDSLEHVLSHLLDNALSCSDGPVLLEADEVDGQVQVSVTDAGPGVYSGDLPRLFEGYGIDETGLRLYLCRRLVELMGGRIWCESRLGAGSRFIFTLPAQRQPVWGHGAAAASADRVRPPGSASSRS